MHGAECRRNDKTGVRAKHQRSRASLKFARSGTLASLKPDVFMVDTREIRIGRQSELETTGTQERLQSASTLAAPSAQLQMPPSGLSNPWACNL